MQHLTDLTQTKLDQAAIVTIGVFDGVHKGHQHLIRQLVEKAHSTGRLAIALTFYPHPDVMLRNLKGRYYLTSPEEKAQRLSDLGIDIVVTQPFNEALRQIRAADFVDQLRHHLNAESLWIGADFAMGYQREGNVEFLQNEGKTKGFSVQVVDLLMSDTDAISSSQIRLALENGDVENAKAWLGRAYEVGGIVVKGEQRGRKIGFPTANIQTWEAQVIPANGVYAGWATVNGERHMAMTNVGTRPTFDGQDITVEPHLLDFDRDIYDEHLSITFEKRLRPEMRFNGIDALIAQIKQDVETGRQVLTSENR